MNDEPLLSRDEELALFGALRAGDRDAGIRLAQANARLVLRIAQAHRRRSFVRLRLLDLVAAGQDGLGEAIDRFDPDRGFRFSTYATHWIRQAIAQRSQAG